MLVLSGGLWLLESLAADKTQETFISDNTYNSQIQFINKQMEKDITEVFNSPEIQMPLRAMDYPSTVINGTSLQKFIADEVVMYTKLFKDFDITPK